MSIPVFASGMHIEDDGTVVIDADEMYAAGVSKLEFVEGEAPEGICECGHSANTHDPCCVSACGCDGFEPRKPTIEELFKAVMREIKDLAQDALGYEQICDPVQAVRRLAQEFAGMKRRAQMADARNALLFKEKADAIERIEQLEAQIRDAGDYAEKLQIECSELEAQLNTEMAEHTREVLRHGITKHRAEKAEKLAKAIRRIHGEAMVRVCGRAEKAEADAARLKEELQCEREYAAGLESNYDEEAGEVKRLLNALKVYANKSMWVRYERDGETTASLFIGNEQGLEDGVLCDGWRFAQASLAPESAAPAEGVKE